MDWYWHLIISIFAIILILFTVLYFVFKSVFTLKGGLLDILYDGSPYMPYKDFITKGQAFFKDCPHEEVNVKSHDNLNLTGLLFTGREKKKFVLHFHGYKASYLIDFTSAKSYYDKGYSCLAVNQRAHGDSDGKYITFGVKERHDVVSWVNFLVDKFGHDIEIVLGGVSMGAATIMMASNLDISKYVKGIICDSGFVSPKQELTYCLKHDYHLPSFPFIPIINLYCKIFAKFSLDEVSCDKCLSESNIPILMVHSTGDSFVPYISSEINFGACKMENKEFFSIETNLHGGGYLVNREEYEMKVDKFFKSINF